MEILMVRTNLSQQIDQLIASLKTAYLVETENFLLKVL